MATHRVGFIGTGKKPVKPGPQGYGMAHRHAVAYQQLESCEIVACADISEENAKAFQEMFGVARTYTDYREMLEKESLDIVSVCTWPALHEPMVVAASQAGVKAIHCEKPMADTWAGSKRMVEVCRANGTLLTFNHQRRFGAPFRQAKRLLDEGVIGKLERLEIGGGNLYDYGSHGFDMCGYFNDERPAVWVIAQIDYREENVFFGAHNENQAFALWQYDNGVYGMASTGKGTDLIGCHNRLIGSDGVIEIGPTGRSDGSRPPVLRYRTFGDASWQVVDCGNEGVHGPDFIERAIADVVRALEDGRPSELNGDNALKATEIIFACWESARRRGRVDLPLDIDDNPLEDLVQTGQLSPAAKPA